MATALGSPPGGGAVDTAHWRGHRRGQAHGRDPDLAARRERRRGAAPGRAGRRTPPAGGGRWSGDRLRDLELHDHGPRGRGRPLRHGSCVSLPARLYLGGRSHARPCWARPARPRRARTLAQPPATHAPAGHPDPGGERTDERAERSGLRADPARRPPDARRGLAGHRPVAGRCRPVHGLGRGRRHRDRLDEVRRGAGGSPGGRGRAAARARGVRRR